MSKLTNSTNSPTHHRITDAIIPDNTFLTDYLNIGRKTEESSDSLLIGSILPVIASILARNVWFHLGANKIYPNVFSILVGKPGDRKSSAINLAATIARRILPAKRFLPSTGSVEAYFDEYDEAEGGDPDKLMIEDDANVMLSIWKKTGYGEAAAASFLKLYDCAPLAETFKRNLKRIPKEGSAPSPRRSIDETSTSVVLGATFNSAKFHGTQVKAGLDRRFLHYVADGPARLLISPQCISPEQYLQMERYFRNLFFTQPVIAQFVGKTATYWEILRYEITAESMSHDGSTSESETHLARLNSQAVHVLKIAMIFQACRAALSGNIWNGWIEDDIFLAAKAHVALRLRSAAYIDTLGSRAEMNQLAEMIYSRVVKDYSAHTDTGLVTLSRTDLTSKFCHHDRPGALRPQDLYGSIIPLFIEQKRVVEQSKEGKKQSYQFDLTM